MQSIHTDPALQHCFNQIVTNKENIVNNLLIFVKTGAGARPSIQLRLRRGPAMWPHSQRGCWKNWPHPGE